MAGVPEILARFREVYPLSGEPRIWRAPGRINLIGEHTDYNLGLVLPMAIDLACLVAAAPSNDGWLRVYSEQFGKGPEWRAGGIASVVARGDWSDRVVGIAWELARRGVRIEGRNLLVSSSVPVGAGLSSSGALGVSVALALGGPREPLELAQLARAAETDFVGVPCGIMDQFIAAGGQAGAAILLDCRSLESRAVKLPEGMAIVAANSMVKHELSASAYRTRVEECAEAARRLGIDSLRDAKLSDLDRLSGIPLKRARHVITEECARGGVRGGGRARGARRDGRVDGGIARQPARRLRGKLRGAGFSGRDSVGSTGGSGRADDGRGIWRIDGEPGAAGGGEGDRGGCGGQIQRKVGANGGNSRLDRLGGRGSGFSLIFAGEFLGARHT